MHDHYIACVMIIFAALLVTIPTYHEMKRAETPAGSELPPGIYADGFAGASSDPAPDRTRSVTRVTAWSGDDGSPHAYSGAALLTTEPGTLGWTQIEGSADAVRGAAIGAIDSSAPIRVSGTEIQ
jgi:hypothetical protein